MKKPNIAIVAGGDSSEAGVSLRSAAGIFSFLDGEKFYRCIVTVTGKTWLAQPSESEKYAIDKNDFSFTNGRGEKIVFDFAYITIHGTPGENGILQGYFELLRLPYSCCSVLPAALSFNKYACNHFLKSFGLRVADSFLIKKDRTPDCETIVATLGLPLFVKPASGGSSFGTQKVKTAAALPAAIENAFSEDGEVLAESFLEGTEVTCGMYKTRQRTVVFPISEVVPKNEFFDYDAKYNGQVEEITPARISADLTAQIQNQTEKIYDLLGCKGIIRVDYIISPQGEITLLEVNTTPGMTPTSFIPQQIHAAGMLTGNVLAEIIENEMQ